MAIACFLLGISFLILIPAVWQYDRVGSASLLWLVVSTFSLTIAEIYLSPVGLSLVTKLSPPSIVSSIMGVWMMSWAAGQLFCGYLGSFYEKMPKDRFFGMIAALCIATGFVMWALVKPLKRAIGHKDANKVDI
jgi:POT family proton-dependent oligopeptide transporter